MTQRYYSDKLEEYLTQSCVSIADPEPKVGTSLSRAIDDWETVVGDYLVGLETPAMTRPARNAEDEELSKRIDRLTHRLSNRMSFDLPRQAVPSPCPQPQSSQAMQHASQMHVLQPNPEKVRSSVAVDLNQERLVSESLDRSMLRLREFTKFINSCTWVDFRKFREKTIRSTG